MYNTTLCPGYNTGEFIVQKKREMQTVYLNHHIYTQLRLIIKYCARKRRLLCTQLGSNSSRLSYL